MTYLSRLTLNPRNWNVQRDLANCHDLHRTILKAFPQKSDGANGARGQFGVLYRIDADRRGKVVLLVQSASEPNWSTLPPSYLAESVSEMPNPATKCVDDSYGRITGGMSLAFRLRANPTRRVGAQNEAEKAEWRGKRVELRTEEDQLAWLRRKSEQGGFELLSVRTNSDVPAVQVAPAPKLEGYKGRRKAGQKPELTFGSVLFEGELRVTDAGRFRETLIRGIGSGKSYGFGLLSIAPSQR